MGNSINPSGRRNKKPDLRVGSPPGKVEKLYLGPISSQRLLRYQNGLSATPVRDHVRRVLLSAASVFGASPFTMLPAQANFSL